MRAKELLRNYSEGSRIGERGNREIRCQLAIGLPETESSGAQPHWQAAQDEGQLRRSRLGGSLSSTLLCDAAQARSAAAYWIQFPSGKAVKAMLLSGPLIS